MPRYAGRVVSTPRPLRAMALRFPLAEEALSASLILSLITFRLWQKIGLKA